MCLACETNVNPANVDAFGERFLQILNDGALALMISVGDRTGLFEALWSTGPSTSADLAGVTGLNERYVREWLGAMTAGHIVECDETGSVFELPAAHAPMLTSAPGADNFAYATQFMALFGTVEDRIVECFRVGGGVPYSAFPRFHELMAKESALTVVAPLFDHILPLVPGLDASLAGGIDVLDAGCGRGRALLEMAARYPASRFTGFDLSEEAIATAREKARERGLTNVTFTARDLSTFHQDAPEETFDLVTAFDAVHDQGRPDHLLAGIRRILRPDGVFLMQDIGASSNPAENVAHPMGAFLYTISCMHCMTVSLAQGGLGVGAMWGEQLAKEFLRNAGFTRVERHTLEHDFQNYYYVVRP